MLQIIHSIQNIPFCVTVDPALGRLDYESLSDQALMEILVDSLESDQKEEFQDANENFHEVCDWSCTTCAEDRIEIISFCSYRFDATQFPFAFIPPHVKCIKMQRCGLKGTLDAPVLPLILENLTLLNNGLHGSIEFQALPRKLKSFEISANNFNGSCLLENLPGALIHFRASQNQFRGEIDLKNLPPAMEVLDLAHNVLTGRITLDHLPEKMRAVFLRCNALSGSLIIEKLPQSMTFMALDNNAFTGVFTLF